MSIAILDKDLPAPLYHQLLCILKVEIEAGKWQPDDRLPTEADIAKRFGISKITVRQAMQALVEQRYVRRQQGLGTFVIPRKFNEGPRDLTSFTEEMRRHHRDPTSRILSQGVRDPEPNVADALGLGPGEAVFVLQRLRIASGEPMGIQTAHIPAALVPNLHEVVSDGSSLYEVLRDRFGLYPSSARETYWATSASPEASTLLGIEPGTAVFEVERVTKLANGKPFEFVQSVMRGDRYGIVLELVKDRIDNTALQLRD